MISDSLSGVSKGMRVVVEPTKPESPAVVLRGHREAITAVAVTRAPKTYILSASEDRTVRVWNVRPGKRRIGQYWHGNIHNKQLDGGITHDHRKLWWRYKL